MTEALVRLDGLRGLADGAAVIAGLCEQYWDHGFPRLDDEDGHRWPRRADRRPVGRGRRRHADGRDPQLPAVPPRRRRALRPVHLAARRGDRRARRRGAQGGAPQGRACRISTRCRTRRAPMPRPLRAAGDAARAAPAAWAAMDAAVTARFGGDAPSTRRVAEALARHHRDQRRGSPARPQRRKPRPRRARRWPRRPRARRPRAGGGGARRPAGRACCAPARTRSAQLEEIATFFRKTEPHSPLAFTLDDAVRRARMPLPDLLAEVLPDAGGAQADADLARHPRAGRMITRSPLAWLRGVLAFVQRRRDRAPQDLSHALCDPDALTRNGAGCVIFARTETLGHRTSPSGGSL